MKQSKNYEELKPYIPENNYEENYALLTHYLMMPDSKDKTEKRNELIKKYEFEDEKLKEAEDFFDTKNVRFKCQENSSFTFIDLFAGIGGFRIAMQDCGGRCVYSSEFDDAAKQTYYENYGEVPFGDITKQENKDFIPKDFDVLCAGFPCQPFSYSGKKKGFEDRTRGTLFFEICKILAEHKPQYFFLENVKGLITHDNGKTINTINSILQEELHYNICETVLSSLDFGLPQKRERWYCVGSTNKLDFIFPIGTKKISTLRDIVDLNNKDPKLKLPEFEIERIKYHFKHAENRTSRVKHDNSKYGKNTKKGKYGIYSFQKPDGSLRFHVGDASKTQIQEAFYSCLDTYASTIIANRTPKLWDIERKLSVEESLELQGFPKLFCMPVSDNQAYKELGNSVSVPVLKAIGSKLVKLINSEE